MVAAGPNLWGWAKTNRRDPVDPGFAWLSYLDHGLDVAAVLRALAEGPYRGLIRALFGRDDDELLDGLASLAGLHDLAKASWTFQGMERGPTPRGKFSYIHHTEEACALLWEVHRTALPGLAAALRPIADLADADDRALLRAAFSHHGMPRNGRGWESQLDLIGRMRPLAATGQDPLALVRQLVEALPVRFGPHPFAGLDAMRRNAALHGLMGLVNLADWIGSSVAWFPLRPERPDRFDRWWAAHQALAEIGWPLLGLSHADDDEAVRQVLAHYTGGRARTLRHVQARVVAAIKAAPPMPGDVLVLEEETGGGKTLAAYLIHALLARRGLCTGLTFCLPTRASARAIHEGAARVYNARTVPVLAVGGYDGSPVLPRLADRSATDSASKLGQGELGWAARSRHRFLAAPVAVGTVDQVLLGVLTVKYAHIRQVAPACNLLVVDEVHASDPYMRGLLREVVQRRRAMGGITLLMSATLGADLRDELLAPASAPTPTATSGRRTLRGSSQTPQKSDEGPAARITEEAPYPVLWLRPDNPVRLTDSLPTSKDVEIEPSGDWPEGVADLVAARAIAAARAGARVLVIRNTVGLARATAVAVSALDPALMLCLNRHPVCHHARFAAQDRLALDGALMAALDPEPASRGQGVVTVTTQTAEQSLDVDADLLITDLVPADVLLQRIGRLHRNRSAKAAAARPVGFTNARCVVLGPADPAMVLSFAASPGRGPNNWGTDRAYADTLAVSATREMIGAGALWCIPTDNRRLVEGATSETARAAIAERFGVAGAEAQRRVSARSMFHNEKRREVSWSFWENPDGKRLCEVFETGADGMAATRLGLSDCRIEVDPPFPSPFGPWTIGAVTVPGWLALALELPGDGRAAWRQAGEEVELAVEGHRASFSYGPFGLAPLQTGR
jgi:CRISPR-associated endonuclease/helicase Cas3